MKADNVRPQGQQSGKAQGNQQPAEELRGDSPGGGLVDALHPNGRCECGDEGRCEWCRAGVAAGSDYRAIQGCAHWRLALRNKYDPIGVQLVRGHYSRRKPDSPQFMPPGETIVFISNDSSAVWGWWRPHPRSGIVAMNGRDGWTCSVFANHGSALSSELVLEAETALFVLESCGYTAAPCGPDGMMTYVHPKKIRSRNPGYCFKRAGWRKIGLCAKGVKHLLAKPFAIAGRLAA